MVVRKKRRSEGGGEWSEGGGVVNEMERGEREGGGVMKEGVRGGEGGSGEGRKLWFDFEGDTHTYTSFRDFNSERLSVNKDFK